MLHQATALDQAKELASRSAERAAASDQVQLALLAHQATAFALIAVAEELERVSQRLSGVGR
jgi:hypothetical protein